MRNDEILNIVSSVLDKYHNKGATYKLFDEIMFREGIKFKEIEENQDDFLGALVKTNSNQNCIIINKNIDNVGRKHFTIAHELGHYFLNHQLNNAFLFCSKSDVLEGGYQSDPIEREANYFASCFLMPEEMLKKEFNAIYTRVMKVKVKDLLIVSNNSYKTWIAIRDNLIKRFGVSEAALRYRLQKLNLAKFEFKEQP